MTYVVCALYKFVELKDFVELRQPLLDEMTDKEICGTLLLAREGINGTVAGSRENIDALLAWLNKDERLNPIETKQSHTEEKPFKRTKVKLKKEIVTMGVEDIDPNKSVGTYVQAKDWNALIQSPDVVLVDTRNEYEYEVGTFKDAVNPHTESFREFPDYVKENLDPNKHKRVAMFCTGGIRCEKASSYMLQQGFAEVFHLKGGILKYLEEVPAEQSLWQGECFVFDNRVTVKHGLEEGSYDLCHGCRKPISEEDKRSTHFQQGISCPHCFDQLTEDQRARFQERQKQIELAKARNEPHIGYNVRLNRSC